MCRSGPPRDAAVAKLLAPLAHTSMQESTRLIDVDEKQERLSVRGALQRREVPQRRSCPLLHVGRKHDAIAVHVAKPSQRHVGGATKRDGPRVERTVNGRANGKVPLKDLLAGRIVDSKGALLDEAAEEAGRHRRASSA